MIKVGGLDNWFKNMRKPTFIQRVFGDKEGEQALIRKVDYFFFNEAINRRHMRTKITWALDYSPYYDKDGKLIDKAWALKPTATIGRIQDIIGGTVEEGRVQIERRKTRFARALTPYVASLGEDGITIFKAEVLRRAAAAAETEATFHDNMIGTRRRYGRRGRIPQGRGNASQSVEAANEEEPGDFWEDLRRKHRNCNRKDES